MRCDVEKLAQDAGVRYIRPETRSVMAKLKKLEILKFRNVQPTTLEFSDRFNVVLGKNGTGKTTLLELVALSLSDMEPVGRLSQVAFELCGVRASAVAQFEFKWIRSRSEPAVSLPQMPVRELPTFDSVLDLSMTAGDYAKKLHVTVSEVVTIGGRTHPRSSGGSSWDVGIFDLVSVEDTRDFRVRLQAYFATHQRTTRFDEALIRLAELRTATFVAGGTGAGISDLPPDIRDALSKRADDEAMPAVILPTPQSLRWAANMLGVAEIEVVFPAPSKHDALLLFAGVRFRIRQSNGDTLFDDDLSFGQQRLLSFALHLGSHPDVVVADELVNGLHNEWIKECVAQIGTRQAFLTSQNPLLVDYLVFNSAEEVRRTFLLCSSEKSAAGKETLVWRNMTTDEAADFYAAYETGISYVSEVLMSKGFW